MMKEFSSLGELSLKGTRDYPETYATSLALLPKSTFLEGKIVHFRKTERQLWRKWSVNSKIAITCIYSSAKKELLYFVELHVFFMRSQSSL